MTDLIACVKKMRVFVVVIGVYVFVVFFNVLVTGIKIVLVGYILAYLLTIIHSPFSLHCMYIFLFVYGWVHKCVCVCVFFCNHKLSLIQLMFKIISLLLQKLRHEMRNNRCRPHKELIR